MDAVDRGGRERRMLGHASTRATTPPRRRRQAARSTKSTSVVRVGDHAVLRAGQEAEQRAIFARRDVGTRRRPSPQRIPFRRLDFDDLGAAVGEQLRAVGAGDPVGQVDDDVPVERRSTRLLLLLAVRLAQPEVRRELAVVVVDRSRPARCRWTRIMSGRRRPSAVTPLPIDSKKRRQQAAHVLALVLL